MKFLKLFQKQNTSKSSSSDIKNETQIEKEVYSYENIKISLVVRENAVSIEDMEALEIKVRNDFERFFESNLELLYRGLINYAFGFITSIEEVEVDEDYSDEDYSEEDIKRRLMLYKEDKFWEIINIEHKEEILNYVSDLKLSLLSEKDFSSIMDKNTYFIDGNCTWELEHGLGLRFENDRLTLVSDFESASSNYEKANYLNSENENVSYFLNGCPKLASRYRKMFEEINS